MKRIFTLCLIAAAALTASLPLQAQTSHSLTFKEGSGYFINPECGFYFPTDFGASPSWSYDDFTLKASIQGLESRVPSKLVQTQYSLLNYREKDLPDVMTSSDALFVNMRASLKELATNKTWGVKTVLRFYYSNWAEEFNAVNDATTAQMRQHIQALKPLFQAYKTGIAAVEAGFVGTWGEWYYTEQATKAEKQKACLDELLAAVPEEIPILVRTPQYKQDYIAALEKEGASSEKIAAAKKRIGFHDDALFSDDADQGTYVDSDDKAYLIEQTKDVAMGGETDYWGAYNNTAASVAKAREYFKSIHLSYLNSTYQANLINFWQQQGFQDELRKKMGYRFWPSKVEYSDPAAGSDLAVTFTISNTGWAVPIQSHGLAVTLNDGGSHVLATATLSGETDMRKWYPGEEHTLTATFAAADISALTTISRATIAVRMPDEMTTTIDGTTYDMSTVNARCIQFAVDSMYDSATGYNNVGYVKLPGGVKLAEQDASAQETINKYAGQSCDVTINRTFTADGGWYSLCVPFDVNATQIADAFGKGTHVAKFTGMSGTHMQFATVTSFAAGEPVLIKPGTTVDGPTFYGVKVTTTAPQTVSAGDMQLIGTYAPVSLSDDGKTYFISSDKKGTALATPSKTNNMRGYRAYFHSTISSAKAYSLMVNGISLAPAQETLKEITETAYIIKGMNIANRYSLKALQTAVKNAGTAGVDVIIYNASKTTVVGNHGFNGNSSGLMVPTETGDKPVADQTTAPANLKDKDMAYVWNISASGSGYKIKNKKTGKYLTLTKDATWGTITLSSTPTVFGLASFSSSTTVTGITYDCGATTSSDKSNLVTFLYWLNGNAPCGMCYSPGVPAFMTFANYTDAGNAKYPINHTYEQAYAIFPAEKKTTVLFAEKSLDEGNPDPAKNNTSTGSTSLSQYYFKPNLNKIVDPSTLKDGESKTVMIYSAGWGTNASAATPDCAGMMQADANGIALSKWHNQYTAGCESSENTLLFTLTRKGNLYTIKNSAGKYLGSNGAVSDAEVKLYLNNWTTVIVKATNSDVNAAHKYAGLVNPKDGKSLMTEAEYEALYTDKYPMFTVAASDMSTTQYDYGDVWRIGSGYVTANWLGVSPFIFYDIITSTTTSMYNYNDASKQILADMHRFNVKKGLVSSYSVSDGSNLADGDYATPALSSSSNIDVTLKSATTKFRVFLGRFFDENVWEEKPHTNRPAILDVYGSTDGKSYTLIKEITAYTDGLPAQQYNDGHFYLTDEISASTAYQYLRFHARETNTSARAADGKDATGMAEYKLAELYVLPVSSDEVSLNKYYSTIKSGAETYSYYSADGVTEKLLADVRALSDKLFGAHKNSYILLKNKATGKYLTAPAVSNGEIVEAGQNGDLFFKNKNVTASDKANNPAYQTWLYYVSTSGGQALLNFGNHLFAGAGNKVAGLNFDGDFYGLEPNADGSYSIFWVSSAAMTDEQLGQTPVAGASKSASGTTIEIAENKTKDGAWVAGTIGGWIKVNTDGTITNDKIFYWKDPNDAGNAIRVSKPTDFDTDNYKFDIEQAEYLAVTLNKATTKETNANGEVVEETHTYATFFSPVAMTVPSGSGVQFYTTYEGTQIKEDEEYSELTLVEFTEGQTIPAGTPLILRGDADASSPLQIPIADPLSDSNDKTPSLYGNDTWYWDATQSKMTGDAGTSKYTGTSGGYLLHSALKSIWMKDTSVPFYNQSIYTFGRRRGTDSSYEVGFYRYTGTVLRGQSVYILGVDADELLGIKPSLDTGNTSGEDPDVARSKRHFLFDFDGAVTGIRRVKPAAGSGGAKTTGADDGAIYDLSGMRVLFPVKGHIYIRGGRKFIAR